MNEVFHRVAVRTSVVMGSSYAFLTAISAILVWAAFGPGSGYSNTWQLIINTGTTITTFLMVFLIQNTQNRDSKAMHLKLDELLKNTVGARSGLIDLEDLSDSDLEALDADFRKLHDQEYSTITNLLHEHIRSVHHKRKTTK
jgi:low affinity Fe/Cu permease